MKFKTKVQQNVYEIPFKMASKALSQNFAVIGRKPRQ